MISPSKGEISIEQVSHVIEEFIKQDGEYNIVIGTDSQNFNYTKVVVVIAVQRIGHGGIFFYDIHRVKRITDLRQKLFYETQLSLKYADILLKELSVLKGNGKNSYKDKIHFSIHIDAGENGDSGRFISAIVGWVRACGYNVETKPDSFAASSIANKMSK